MKHRPGFFAAIVILTSFGSAIPSTFAQENKATRKATLACVVIQRPDFGPGDVFPDFPQFKFGMTFAEAKALIEKSGGVPGGIRKAQDEMAWNGTFAGLEGRATVLFNETGLWEVAVIAFAMERRTAVYNEWEQKITAKLGPPYDIQDDEISLSKLWKARDGVALELRILKDNISPVIDIHWVKV